MESHINQERSILWSEDDERARLKLEFCSITVTTEAAGLYERAVIISLNWKLKEDLNRPNDRSDKGGLYTKRKSASNGREGNGRPGRDSSDHVCQYYTGKLPVIEWMYKDACKYNLTPLYIPRIKHFSSHFHLLIHI